MSNKDKTDKEMLLKKIELSMNDPIFVSDMKEIMDDFKYIDSEIK